MMFNHVVYRITGLELSLGDKNEPSSTFIKVTLNPIRNDRFGIKKPLEINFDLEDIKKMTVVRGVKMQANQLQSLETTRYNQWIGIARSMFAVLLKTLYHKKIKLSI